MALFINPSEYSVEIDPGQVQRDATQFDYPTKDTFKGITLINTSNWIQILKELRLTKILITTGDPKERWDQIQLAKKSGLRLINAIHPSALVMEDAILEDNIILHAKSYVGYRAELYSGSSLNTGAQVDHHNVIKECVTIDPGVIFAGNVTVGRFSKIHTGVVVKNRIRIGENTIIGAGTVIIKDVPDNVTIVGVPGKIIKNN